jgi:hypothetical protein
MKSGRGRAQAHPVSFIFGLSLMVVVLLLAIVLIVKIRGSLQSVEDDAPCATSIIAHSAAVAGSKELVNLPIICPTRGVTVKGTDEEKVKEQLAKEMRYCWGMWGQGKLQLFGDKDNVYCHICSIVRTDEVQSVTGLPDYLDTHMANKSVTYAQYLAGQKSGKVFIGDQFNDAATTKLDTSKPVAVIFYYAKGHTFMERLWNTMTRPATAATAGGAAGAVVGYGIASIAGGPVTIIAFAVGVAGAATATALGITYRADSSFMSVVMVRTLTSDQLSETGCSYAPVQNQ